MGVPDSLLFLLAWVGGVLTIASPCILPVIPFVFARADRPFRRNGLPLLAGMAVTFALVASLAAVAGGWVVAANQWGRWLALCLFAAFGLSLLWPALGERFSRPLVALGDRLSRRVAPAQTDRPVGAFVLGIATGLLWTPCAGPVLGLILTGAALQGASAATLGLLLAYGLGAAMSLALALLWGGRLLGAMKRSLGAGVWLRRGLGTAMMVAVAAIALGFDAGLLTRVASSGSVVRLEQALVDRFAAAPAASDLPNQGEMPPLDGATAWLNSMPLASNELRGKVVLIDFWTYSCINCLRALPYVKAWSDKYRKQGLTVVGVHAPEFAFERDLGNVRNAVARLGIEYPVALDNSFSIWRAFRNRYWPAHWFIDANGRIRYHHFGEGNYEQSERVIQQLLREAGAGQVDHNPTQVAAAGVQMAADWDSVRSPETYIGYERAQQFSATPALARDRRTDYKGPVDPGLNRWGLDGSWTVGAEQARLESAGGSIVFRFQARDLHLVLGSLNAGQPVRFRVTVDDQPPGADHGLDVAPDGSGQVAEQRLYQLVRQRTGTARTFRIEFLDPGVSAYAFTFG